MKSMKQVNLVQNMFDNFLFCKHRTILNYWEFHLYKHIDCFHLKLAMMKNICI